MEPPCTAADMCRYVNYAHGDESLDAVYGDSLQRLIKLKRKYDPEGRFSQFFPIPTREDARYI